MKKHLLASTALIAAGVLVSSGAYAQAPMSKAKKPVFTLGGYMEMTIGSVIDEKHDQAAVPGLHTSAVDVFNESEVHFNARATLDNGITIVGRIELEGDGDGTPAPNATPAGLDPIDEVWLSVRGTFGQLDLGSMDNAGHRMSIGYSGSWATGVGQNLTFDVTDYITPVTTEFDTLRDGRLRNRDDDREKVSYFTPRFEGFQLGASYIPNQTQDANFAFADAAATFHDGIAFGANYDRKFGDFGLGVAGGYLRFEAPDGGTLDDQQSFIVATRVDFGPIRVAGSYKRQMSHQTVAGTDFRGRVIDVGARYIMGPNQFSFGYLNGELDTGAQKYYAANFSYARILGPGVKWYATLAYGDSKVLVAPGENDGYGIGSGIRLDF